MSLSKYLQSPELLKNISGKPPEKLRDFVLEKGLAWYEENEEETIRIRNNLNSFGFNDTEELVNAVKMHVVLHYYEKILPLVFKPAQFCDFLQDRIECTQALDSIKNAREQGKAILIATAHFGAVELLVPVFASCKLPVHVVLKFSTGHFSQVAHEYAQRMHQSERFGPIHLIEVGKPGTQAALDMAAVLRKREILMSVFDEKTEYSIPVSLFEKRVWGGAGLDKLLNFCQVPVTIFNAFMIRKDIHTFTLSLIEAENGAPNLIQAMFWNLEKIVRKHVQQWYFLHEEIPFVG